MTAETLPSSGLDLDAAALDAALLDAAVQRTSRALAGHWLHGLRGSLNAISLNLVLLRSHTADLPAHERTLQALRGQVRELDTALTRLLDRSWLDDTQQQRTELAPLVASLCALVEPLARRRLISVDCRCPEPSPAMAVDPVAIHGVLFVLAADAIEQLPARTAFTLEVETSTPRGLVRIDLSAPEVPAAIEARDAALFGAAQRILGRLGGEVRRPEPGGTGLLRIHVPAVPLGREATT
jgi:signal transduction histidine kinase